LHEEIFLSNNSNTLSSQVRCNCPDAANSLMSFLEVNYVDRDALKSNKEFLSLKSGLSKNSFTYFNDSCLKYFYKVVASIKDPHITFRVREDTSFSYRYASPEETDILYRQFQKNKFKDFTGLWELNEGDYRYIVVKNPSLKQRYDVIVWSALNGLWEKGYLKGAIYQISDSNFLYISYLNKQTATCFLLTWDGHGFFSTNTGRWHRRPNFSAEPRQVNLQPELRILQNGNVYLKMPSFLTEYKQPLDSIIVSNADKIKKADHLIIDVRDNLGGSRRVYSEVLKYLYTKPIFIESAWFLSTPEIIKAAKRNMASYPQGSSLNNYYKERIARKEQNLGHLYYDTVFQKPSRISILVNRRCGSACELFLISAKQSEKVTIFGESSNGAIDRGDAYIFDCGCSNLSVSIPVSKRIPEVYKMAIDNIGIPPDVPLQPHKDWIKQVNRHYEKSIKNKKK
jgi:Peptidase family S41